jgi:catechol 2,3-dioxygenase-like lactoylglutathione lyase family enzyme
MVMPGYVYTDHVGLTVPDLDEAVRFFTEVFGAHELYRSSRSGDARFISENYEVSGAASFLLAMLRLPPNLNIELFQWDAPGPAQQRPRASDAGGHHLCIYVNNIKAACDYLAAYPRVRLLGEIKTVGPGSPVAGTRWTYFMTPWGLQMELVDRAGVVDLPEFVTPIGDPSRDR